MEESILLVRHGPGRGRLPGFWNEALEYLARHHPCLSRRLRLHHTGEPRPSLDDVAAVVFWLGDPLEERYPDCFAEAVEIASRTSKVVNPPRALSNTIKSRQATLWHEAGLPTPSSRLFHTREELEEILDHVRYPVLVRPDHLHSASNIHLCRDREEARSLPPSQVVYPGTVTRFVDVRRSYRSRLPGTLWAEFYHKKRAFVLGDAVLPGHMYFSRTPIVRASESTLSFQSRMRHRARHYLRHIPRWDRRLGLLEKVQRAIPLGRVARRSVQREVAFTTSAPERPGLMRKAARALGLDFVALDYSVLADGRVVLWEANPYPNLTRWQHGIVPIRRRLRQRNARIFEALADLLRTLGGKGAG